MLINEMVRRDWESPKIDLSTPSLPVEEPSVQEVVGSIQISTEDQARIFTPKDKQRAQFVFFPGCNVYLQPNLLLNALDLIELITEDYAFIPGLIDCCGDNYLFDGDFEGAESHATTLLEKIRSYEPETVIFWCATCQVRFETVYADFMELPFKIVSLSQFLLERKDQLPQKRHAAPQTVTLHEACKSGFTGVDQDSVRRLLQELSGINLVEMPRHGKNAACCGSGASAFFPDSFQAVREERLLEAVNTGADTLVDVCHFCHNTFATAEQTHGLQVENYIALIARAAGIEREDTLKKYRLLGSANRILANMQGKITCSPYPPEVIRKALEQAIHPAAHQEGG